MLGYTKKLYILPFDHRASFVRSFIGENVEKLNKQQKKTVESYKKIIYDGFLFAYKKLKNKELAAILVDQAFGASIIKSAQKKKINTLVSTEKSGQKLFAFEYGNDFAKEILQTKPDIVKVLVRYNPANIKDNITQLKRLKRLDDWCKAHDYKFLAEILVPATKADLAKVKGNQEKYDKQIRPRLAVKMVKEFHQAGIEPDIWKIEAFTNKSDWEKVISIIRQGKERKDVGIIMLGRGVSFAKVKQWIDICPQDKVNGFAVGRTVFLRALKDYYARRINKKEAIEQIAKNYLELVRYWEK